MNVLTRCRPQIHCGRSAQPIDVAMPYYTAIISSLAVEFDFFHATRVSGSAQQVQRRLPTTTGNPNFERIFRAHMNTLE